MLQEEYRAGNRPEDPVVEQMRNVVNHTIVSGISKSLTDVVVFSKSLGNMILSNQDKGSKK